MVVDVVVQNPQKSNVCEYEKKHVRSVGVHSGIMYGCVRSVGVYSGRMYGCVRSVGVYSGIMYGCVRYVLRVARADSGWGVRERSEPFIPCFSNEEKTSLLLLRMPLLLLPLLLLPPLQLHYVLLVGPARCFIFLF